jgi:hypothetical protein
LPGPRESISWPVYNGRDLSLLGNWRGWLGVFAQDPSSGFAGVYDDAFQFGAVRVFDPATAPGVKLFGFGPGFADVASYADDGSSYVELWGGPARTFWPEDRLSLAPGQVVSWREVWFPIPAIGGLSAANREAALYLETDAGGAVIGAYSPLNLNAVISLWVGGFSVKEEPITLGPDSPQQAVAPSSEWQGREGPITLRLTDSAGRLILEVTR